LTKRLIAMLTYPGAQSLDVTGPLEVFSLANQQMLDDASTGYPTYQIMLIAPSSGSVQMSSGLCLIADAAYSSIKKPPDTLLISGGMGHSVHDQIQDRNLIDWLSQMKSKTRRMGSICNGALILAECGVLDGRRATTHWKDVDFLEQSYPETQVIADAIYVKDGHVWTSAGITAGMDLALALVADDLGMHIALKIAKRLVLFMKRSGGQRQFSDFLSGQMSSDLFAGLLHWLRENMSEELSVARMAEYVHMSPRGFARKFKQEIGQTPMKYLECVRIECAKSLLENTKSDLAKIAQICGFHSQEHLRRAFLRQLNVLPQTYREHFGS